MAMSGRPFNNSKTEACFRHCEFGEAISRLGMKVMVRLFNNLTPFIPLSLKGEGDEIIEEGLSPLLNALLLGSEENPREASPFLK